MQQAATNLKTTSVLRSATCERTVTFAILAPMIIGTLVIGPQRVYAAVLQLFGYIPGVGIVDQNSPIRLLAEPVSITRDGITVSVNQVVLTGNRNAPRFWRLWCSPICLPKGGICIGMRRARISAFA